jgi:putative oxidoreductase
MKPLLQLIARILVATIFLITGFQKLTHFSGTQHTLAHLGIPMANIAAGVATLIEFGGAISLILGFQARIASAIMFLYTIIVTVKVHNFWDAPPAAYQDQYIHFLKNLAILGALLGLAANGAGAFSVDGRGSRAA